MTDSTLVFTSETEADHAGYGSHVLPVERSERISIPVLRPRDHGTFVRPRVGLFPLPIGRDARDVRGRCLETRNLHPA